MPFRVGNRGPRKTIIFGLITIMTTIKIIKLAITLVINTENPKVTRSIAFRRYC